MNVSEQGVCNALMIMIKLKVDSEFIMKLSVAIHAHGSNIMN